MASYNEESHQYHIFLENIAKSAVEASEVTYKAQNVKIRSVSISDHKAEVIYWILKFLDDKKCPTKLIAPIVRNVIVEIQANIFYDNPGTDYRSLTINILEDFCVRLLDNVELNKILDTASHSGQQQLTDDLLSIPIRAVASEQNKRRTMEDRNICIDEFDKVYDIKDSPKASFYGVFDGHGGHIAAQYAAIQLPFEFSKLPTEAIYPAKAFECTDNTFISRCNTSGTTALCALYRPEEGRLLISWVGDSKAMLAKKQGKIMQLVTPHTGALAREKDRISSLGGSVYYRSGAYRVNGFMMVTRSIGDMKMKDYLISLPDCVLVELDKEEEFLVMATDGLWDHASEANIAKTVYDCIKEDCGEFGVFVLPEN